jgi:putative FmdB family regulatory protein
MPIYQYECRECGAAFEVFSRGYAIDEKLACPGCGSGNLEKQISAPSLLKVSASTPGTTCCGRTERCETPPCSTGEHCRRM